LEELHPGDEVHRMNLDEARKKETKKLKDTIAELKGYCSRFNVELEAERKRTLNATLTKSSLEMDMYRLKSALRDLALHTTKKLSASELKALGIDLPKDERTKKKQLADGRKKAMKETQITSEKAAKESKNMGKGTSLLAETIEEEELSEGASIFSDEEEEVSEDLEDVLGEEEEDEEEDYDDEEDDEEDDDEEEEEEEEEEEVYDDEKEVEVEKDGEISHENQGRASSSSRTRKKKRRIDEDEGIKHSIEYFLWNSLATPLLIFSPLTLTLACNARFLLWTVVG
jgi:hypothetical protein